MAFELVHDGFAKIFRSLITKREIALTADSVGAVVHVYDKDSILCVNQLREAMYRPDNSSGNIIEIPAGRFVHEDAGLSVLQLLSKEGFEEIGANITADQIELINSGISMALSPGFITERMTLAYIRIHSSQVEEKERVFGVASENERIERVWIKIDDIPSFVPVDMKTFGGLQWFLNKLRSEGRSI
jgi:hypothetical protein